MKKKILLIGPVPPPTGGISIHIKRLSILLENDYSIDFIDEVHTIKTNYFNIRSLNLFTYIKKIFCSDLVFIHSGSYILRIFHVIMSKLFFKKIILTFHSYPLKHNKTVNGIEKFVYKKASKIIIVNKNVFENIKLPQFKCIVQNAFLPPDMQTEPELPVAIIEWINKSKSNGKIIMCANAWQLQIFNNEELYGLDMCIEAVNKLKKEGYPVCFIFNVASTDKLKELYLYYQSKIRELGLSNDFLLINESLSFVKLIEKTDIVLRPTNTDGDALTVREALFLGKPVVASDVVERPVGTKLFVTRDVDDMCIKLEKIINQTSKENCNNKIESKDSYRKFYKNLIDSVIFNN
jgi:glycosyltransferase involved in cell wall biosynthesis